MRHDDLVVIKTGRGVSLIHDGYQYYKKKVYTNGAKYWRCSERAKNKCTGSLTVKVRMKIFHLL